MIKAELSGKWGRLGYWILQRREAGLAHIFSQAETGREPAPTAALWFLTQFSVACLSLDYQAYFTIYQHQQQAPEE